MCLLDETGSGRVAQHSFGVKEGMGIASSSPVSRAVRERPRTLEGCTKNGLNIKQLRPVILV